MIEDVLVEMKRILDTHLGEELGRQDAKFADGIRLDAPKTVSLGVRSIPQQGLPSVILAPAWAGQFEYATARKDVTHQIEIGIVVADSNQENGYRRLWRTLRAIENALEVQSRNGSGPMIDYRTTSIEYDAGPFDTANEDSLIKAGVLTCEVRERQVAYDPAQI